MTEKESAKRTTFKTHLSAHRWTWEKERVIWKIDLNNRSNANENILGSHIPMDNTVGMQVLQWGIVFKSKKKRVNGNVFPWKRNCPDQWAKITSALQLLVLVLLVSTCHPQVFQNVPPTKVTSVKYYDSINFNGSFWNSNCYESDHVLCPYFH